MTDVLHVVPSLDPASGGPARSVPGLCSAEAEAGARVSLICFGDGNATAPENVRTTTLSPFPGTRQGITPSSVRKLRAAVAEAQLVHMHSLWNPPTSVALSVARSSGTPYVISPRGMLQETSLGRKSSLKKFAGAIGERAKIAAASGIHFLTDEERDASVPFGDLPARVLVLPNGIELDLARTVTRGGFRERWPSLLDRKVVLFVGRLHWSKGLDTQLEAMAELGKTRDDFVWVLIGPDEGEWSSLQRSVVERGLEPRVMWLGSQPHEVCLEAICDADVVLMTSRHEAHSMAMNEALALGTPLVMADTVGFPTLAEGGAALSVAAEPRALAAAVQLLLADDRAASEISEKAVRFAEETLAWPQIARRMLSFYDEILSDGGVLSAG